jgi:catechol 2,3-dioxygenase-like lactoylglutathione lyase family enzyme
MGLPETGSPRSEMSKAMSATPPRSTLRPPGRQRTPACATNGPRTEWGTTTPIMPSMVSGTHTIIFADDAEKARAFFRDVLGLPSVDAGEGWLIFALPPAELGVHPGPGWGQAVGHHELFLMCHDIQRTVDELEGRGVALGAAVQTSVLSPTLALLASVGRHHRIDVWRTMSTARHRRSRERPGSAVLTAEHSTPFPTLKPTVSGR